MQTIEPLMPWDMRPYHPRWTEVLRDQTHETPSEQLVISCLSRISTIP